MRNQVCDLCDLCYLSLRRVSDLIGLTLPRVAGSTPRQSVRVPSLNLGHSGTSSCLSSFASNAPSR